MPKLKQISTTRAVGSPTREADLRRAQEQAFDEVKRARSASEREFAMQRAVAELIDACERYISGTAVRSA